MNVSSAETVLFSKLAVGQSTLGLLENEKLGRHSTPRLWWFRDGEAGCRLGSKKIPAWTPGFFYTLQPTAGPGAVPPPLSRL
jgi:hypothetical protein